MAAKSKQIQSVLYISLPLNNNEVKLHINNNLIYF